jgi:hypothetical protein
MNYATNRFKMILLLLKGARAWGYFVALVSLYKDLSVRDLSGTYNITMRAIWLWL